MALREMQTAAAQVVFLPKATRRDVEEVGRRFHYHPLDLEAVLAVPERSKVSSYGQYTFLTLLWPTNDGRLTDIRFFVDQRQLIIIGDTADHLTDSWWSQLLDQGQSAMNQLTPVELLADVLRQWIAMAMPMAPAWPTPIVNVLSATAQTVWEMQHMALAAGTITPAEQADLALLAHQLEQVPHGSVMSAPVVHGLRPMRWLNGYAVASAVTMIIVILALTRH